MPRDNVSSVRKWMSELSTDQLDDMLQAELEKEVPDGNAVRLILDVLWEREKGNPVEMTPGTEKAWEKYQRDAAAIDQRKGISVFSRSGLLRVASIAVVCLLLFAIVPGQAEAESLWERLAQWTSSIFEYFNPHAKQAVQDEYVFETDNPGLQQVYDAVVEMGVTEPVVPMWLPEGYSMKALQQEAMRQKDILHICFEGENKEIIFNVILHCGESSYWYHKDDYSVKCIEIAGVEYYALQNHELWTISWINDNVECALIIECSEEDMHRILNSIHKLEVK